jgi:hypothetical protein
VVATLALALLTTVAIGLPAFAQNAACARCSDSFFHIGPFSFPNPFARPPPPSEGFRIEDRPSRRHGPSERRQAFGGSMSVCVRTCDGSFFPLPYSGASGATLEEVCQALCPGASVELYSMPFGGTIDEGASATGARYAALPNAFKFQQTYDPNCSCRRPDQSWADALAAAERRFGHHSHDIIVTAEASAEMSRPKPGPAAQATARNAAPPPGTPAPGAAESLDPGLDVEGVDTRLKAATAAVSRETSGIEESQANGGAHFGLKAGRVIEDSAPDGGTRRVRILAPSF